MADDMTDVDAGRVPQVAAAASQAPTYFASSSASATVCCQPICMLGDARTRQERVALMMAYYKRYRQKTTFKTKSDGQRLYVRPDENEILQAQLAAKQTNKGYIDLSYHEAVSGIDEEYNAFCSFGQGFSGLAIHELDVLYQTLIDSSTSTWGTAKTVRAGKGFIIQRDITVDSAVPTTVLNIAFLRAYQDMHYKPELKVTEKDDTRPTRSTRAYEAEYITSVTALPFSRWRPMALPSGGPSQTMVDCFGGLLDVQTPTSGNTLGSGVANKIVYTQFQLTLRNLHNDYDLAFKDENLIARTKRLTTGLGIKPFAGIYEGELQFLEESGFSKEDLIGTINKTIIHVMGWLRQAQEGLAREHYHLNLTGTERQQLKRFKLYSAVFAMSIKVRKRLYLNHILVGAQNKYSQDAAPVNSLLEELAALATIENKINSDYGERINKFHATDRKLTEGKNLAKELKALQPQDSAAAAKPAVVGDGHSSSNETQ